jgi:ATP-dependent Clp protease, protease subunit
MLKMLMMLIVCSIFAQQKIVLSKSNTLVLDDAFNDESVAKLSYEALLLSKELRPTDEIYLLLDTPGGSIYSGLSLIRILNSLPQKVNTITMFAASMGFITVQALSGNRYILEDGLLMSHRAFGGAKGQFDGELNSRLKLNIDVINQMEIMSSKRMGISLENYKKLILNELWVPSFDYKQYNVADEIVKAECDSSLDGTKFQNINFYGMNVELEKANCPLIRGFISVKVSDEFNNVDKQKAFNLFITDKKQFVYDYIINNKIEELSK